MINIHRKLIPLFAHFRAKRMRQFVEIFNLNEQTRVLDVGGSLLNWSTVPVRPRLTIINLPGDSGGPHEGAQWVLGDGRRLPFKDKSFDIVYSNSVIEHVGSFADQQELASEIKRVGKSYYVQTPARWFPIESHLLTPFIHYLPKKAQRKLIRYFTVWGLFAQPSPEICDFFIRTTRLLDFNDLKTLFPDARILRERFVGMTKSFIAVSAG